MDGIAPAQTRTDKAMAPGRQFQFFLHSRSLDVFVEARDGGCCRVPGCGNRTWDHLHHEGGWKNVGHDPEFLVSLCPAHHVARHDELLKIVFDAGRATFSRADGVLLGEVNLRALPPARCDRRARREQVAVAPAHDGAVAPAHDVVAVAPAQVAIVADARKALVALGHGVREANSLIAAAGPWATVDHLVLEALRRKPLPA